MLEDIDAKRALNLFLKREEFQFEACKKKIVKIREKEKKQTKEHSRVHWKISCFSRQLLLKKRTTLQRTSNTYANYCEE